MFNSARKGRLVREQDLGAEEGCGEVGCCPGTGRILRVARALAVPNCGLRAADYKNHPKGKTGLLSDRRLGDLSSCSLGCVLAPPGPAERLQVPLAC